MIRTTLAISFILYAVMAGILLKECAFLSPLRKMIWKPTGDRLSGFRLCCF